MSVLIKGMKMPKSGNYKISIDAERNGLTIMAIGEHDERGVLWISCYELEEIQDDGKRKDFFDEFNEPHTSEEEHRVAAAAELFGNEVK